MLLNMAIYSLFTYQTCGFSIVYQRVSPNFCFFTPFHKLLRWHERCLEVPRAGPCGSQRKWPTALCAKMDFTTYGIKGIPSGKRIHSYGKSQFLMR
jgi:hypothetical protein